MGLLVCCFALSGMSALGIIILLLSISKGSQSNCDCVFTDRHVWFRDNGDGTGTVGISEYGQEMLGDIVVVDLPVIEAFDVYSPVTGEVVDITEELEDSPELINEEP